MGKKTLINQVFTQLGLLSEDYIIVDRSVILLLLQSIDGDKLAEVTTALTKLNELDLESVTPESPHFHLIIRGVRENFGITQTRLAKESNLKQPDISSLEKRGAAAAGFSQTRCEQVSLALKKLTRNRSRDGFQ